LVNFTAALIPLSIASDLLGKLTRRESLNHAAWWMLFYAAAITPLTALFGWLWKNSMGTTDQVMFIHQWLGISLAVAFIILASWRGTLYSRSKSPGIPYFLLAALIAAALMYQGHLGGSMAFG
jgi:uncharacterized membrane protein